jgi:hypothetical protein
MIIICISAIILTFLLVLMTLLISNIKNKKCEKIEYFQERIEVDCQLISFLKNKKPSIYCHNKSRVS